MEQRLNPLTSSQGTGVNVGTYRLVSYALVAAMMACAALTVVNLITRLLPSWQPWYIVVVCFLVALDRLYTYRRFRDWMFMSKEWLLRFGTQLIVMIVLTRLVVGLSHGWRPFLTEFFFSDEFWVVLALVLATWAFCSNFAALLDDIGLDQQLTIQETVDSGQKRPTARQRLMSLFFSLGSVLVVFTALARLDLRAMLIDRTGFSLLGLPALAAGGGSTLLYFMLGLALLSQTQFITLHVRWDMQHIPVSRELAGRWAAYSLVFLVFMAVVVSLLPTGYSMGPIQVLSYLLSLVIYAFTFIAYGIFGVVLTLVNIVAALFGLQPTAANLNVSTIKPPDALTDANAAIASPAWWELLKSLLFWGIFLGVLLFSAVHYLRQHQDALDTLRKLPGWRFLEQLWGWMRGLFTNVKEGVSRAVEAGRARLRARRAAARELLERGFLSFRSLDPRQRVAFFYLALVRRGGESGLPRGRSQTPSEYAATLEVALPDVDREIDSLTEAFIEARYSQRPVQPEKANLVKTTWARIRKALRDR